MPDSEGHSAQPPQDGNHFPNFQDVSTFPPFSELPLTDSSNTSDPSNSDNNKDHYLLATIHENMTLSTTPTYICKDRNKAEFAIKFVPRQGDKLDTTLLKKGHTIVVKNARRSGVKDGKQGYIEVPGNAFNVNWTNQSFGQGESLGGC